MSAGGLGGSGAPRRRSRSTTCSRTAQHAAYYVQSSFISPGRYGFLLDRDELSRLAARAPTGRTRGRSRRPRRASTTSSPRAPRARRSGRLTAITGRHRVPPALGDRADARPPGPVPRRHRRRVRSGGSRTTSATIRRDDIPLAAYRIEGWQYLPRPFLRRGDRRSCARRGIKPLLYFRAFVGSDEIGTDDPAQFDEASRKGYVATTPDGDPYVFIVELQRAGGADRLHQPGRGALVEAADPRGARARRRRVHAGLRRAGADRHALRRRLDRARRCTTATACSSTARPREAVRGFERRHPGRQDLLVHPRRLLGTPGRRALRVRRTSPATRRPTGAARPGWPSLTTDMLNRGIGGAYGFTTDIGGYFDIALPADQQGAVPPLGGVGGALADVPRSTARSARAPTRPGPTTPRPCATTARSAALHQRAEPLIMRLWRQRARDRDPDRAAAVAAVLRRPPRPPSRTRSGCSAATSSSPRWSSRARPGAQGLLPARLLAGARRQALPRAADGPGAGAARAAARGSPAAAPLRSAERMLRQAALIG